MTFVENEFAAFLAVFFLLWWAARRHYQWRLGVMLALSLVFYGFHHWWFVPVILVYCLVDWGAALLMERGPNKKLILGIGVGVNLTVLAFWKYTPLIAATLAGWLGWPTVDAAENMREGWIAPMGISFYAFMGISYMVDVYRGLIPAERSLWRYALFSSFFPHLVAGPILRAREFLWHLRPGELPNRPLAPWEGTFLIARGLFKKLVLADTIALTIDPFFVNVADGATAGVWSLPFICMRCRFTSTFPAIRTSGAGWGCGLGFGGPRISTGRTWRPRCRISGAGGT